MMLSHGKVIAVALAAFLSVSVQALRAEEFDYLDTRSNVVTTTNNMKYQIAINNTFQLLGELHHRQKSRDLLFRVSFVAFGNGVDIVLIHAERLQDETGILNYDYLPRQNLSEVEFGFREQCIPVEAETGLKTNREANFVRDRGYELTLPFLLTQYLSASSDGNAEVVIAYGRSVESCDSISDAFRSDTQNRIDEAINVKLVH
ncbi:MAG: hypothetical protein ABJO09_03535 [Hyphomicrobiales bacterium]